jgi:hypothetical protein
MSTHSIQRIADLEEANYAATLITAQVTSGLTVSLRDDVIMTTSETLPSPDTNHACLLQSSPEHIDNLLDEITDHFRSRDRPTTIFVSPACRPSSLEDLLRARGFRKLREQEAWMVMEDLQRAVIPQPSPKVHVRQIGTDQALAIAQVFVTAFEMPTDFAPGMAQLLAPSIGLPGIHHYLALVDDRPVGTCSLLCYGSYGVLGSAGVVREHRGSRVATSLASRAVTDAKQSGVTTLMLQTAAGTALERFLRISGFKRAFTRVCYMLP